MLTCLTVRSKRVNPLKFLDENRLRLLSRNKRLVCPVCRNSVIYRKGSKVPHFAHYYTKSHCYWKPETEIHLLGKEMVYNICIRQGLECELEKAFPEIQQIADVFIKPNIVIEIQTSRVTKEELAQRRTRYQSIGLKDFWFWGEDVCKSDERVMETIKFTDFLIKVCIDKVIIHPEIGQRYFLVYLSFWYKITGNHYRMLGDIVRYDVLASKVIFWKGIPDTRDHLIKRDISGLIKHIRSLDKFIQNRRIRYKLYKAEWGLGIISQYNHMLPDKLGTILNQLNMELEIYGGVK